MKQRDSANTGMKKVSSAVVNMSALIDDIVKKARKSFSETGSPDIDAKFLKESVGALRELFDLMGEQGGFSQEGVAIKMEKELEDWSK